MMPKKLNAYFRFDCTDANLAAYSMVKSPVNSHSSAYSSVACSS